MRAGLYLEDAVLSQEVPVVVLGQGLGDIGHGGQVATHLPHTTQEQERNWMKSGAGNKEQGKSELYEQDDRPRA